MQETPSNETNIQQIRSLIGDLTQKLKTLPNENLNGISKDLQTLKAALERFPNSPTTPIQDRPLFEIDEENQAFLGSIFQTDPGGIAVISYPDLIYYMVNQAYRLMTPQPELDPIGQSMATVWPERDVEGSRTIFGQILTTGQKINSTYQYLYPNGNIRYYTNHVMPIRWKGNPALLLIFWETTQLELAVRGLRDREHRLKESENFLRDILNGMPDLIWSATSKGFTEFNNERLQEYLGMSLEDVQQKGWMDVYHPDDRARIQEIWDESAQKGTPFEAEFRYRDKDGGYNWFWGRAYPIKDARGSIQKWVGVARDISEQKQIRQELEEANTRLIVERNRLLAMMQAVPVGLAIYNSAGGIDLANSTFEEVWGSPRPPTDSVKDYDLYKAWWVDSGRRVLPEEWAAARAVEKGKVSIGQYIRIQKFNGNQGYILNSGAPIRDVQGQVTGAVVAIMDVSSYVRAEQALRDSEERFRVALSGLPMMVYHMDTRLRYTWSYNPHPVYKQKDFIGKSDYDLFSKEVATPFVLAKRQVIETGRGLQRQVSAMIDGEMKTYLLALEPVLDEDHHISGLTGASLDVTTQRRLDKERMDALAQTIVQRKLLENREKERQILARELHDGPIQLLSSTLFNLQILKELSGDSEMQQEIKQIAAKLKTTVRDLRSLMNGLRPPALIRFGFAKSAAAYAENFREENPQLELSLQFLDHDNLLPEDVNLALFRIFQESLSNIAKHSQATRAWVQLTTDSKKVRLYIHDNGWGFKVPTDFGELTDTGHFGLAGMKERTEGLEGKFSLISVEGSGTTIVATIPIHSEIEP